MWLIVKILWINYMWFIVKILWTWNIFFTLLEISKPLFFSPIFGNAITIIAKKKILFPYFGNGIVAIAFFFFILRALNCRNSTFSTSCFLVILSPLSWFLAEFRYPYSLSCFFGWISATPLPKFSLSPQFPN